MSLRQQVASRIPNYKTQYSFGALVKHWAGICRSRVTTAWMKVGFLWVSSEALLSLNLTQCHAGNSITITELNTMSCRKFAAKRRKNWYLNFPDTVPLRRKFVVSEF